jgi:hypothetical protein
MAMHHHMAVVGARVQQAVADPHHVCGPLGGRRRAGANLRMHEQVIAFAMTVRQGAQEGLVTRRQGLAQADPQNLLPGIVERWAAAPRRRGKA